MYCRKKRLQQQGRLKTKTTAQFGKKPKKSVQYGTTTTIGDSHTDKPGEGGM